MPQLHGCYSPYFTKHGGKIAAAVEAALCRRLGYGNAGGSKQPFGIFHTYKGYILADSEPGICFKLAGKVAWTYGKLFGKQAQRKIA